MNNCVLHQGRINEDGYGVVGRKNARAHRLAWTAKNGQIPAGMQVCHKCDNRACVNVDHLFLGTNQNNIDDKVQKGRAFRTLSPEKCDMIVSLYHSNTQYEIAEMLGVSQGTISRVLNGHRKYFMIGGY